MHYNSITGDIIKVMTVKLYFQRSIQGSISNTLLLITLKIPEYIKLDFTREKNK